MAYSAFVLAAVQSNSGKTTVSMGLMAALRSMGLTVQPYKVGPDYIDPMYHRSATGRFSRNLDSFLLDEQTISYLFEKNCGDADVAVTEGVMGLYDGVGGCSIEGSTAHIAQILGLPVILIVDCSGMSLSLAAMLQGFQNFSPQTRIAGVIFNRVKSEGGYQHAKEIVETNCGIPVFGYLPKDERFVLGNRHLGLYCSEEIADLQEKITIISEALQAHCDLQALLRHTSYTPHGVAKPKLPAPLQTPVCIGYASDQAFNFYYRDSLELLEELGAKLIAFSPLNDQTLPDVDGILLGGGYPELHLPALSGNKSFRTALRSALEQGMPCYAECGGLIYLGASMQMDGVSYPLTGLFPFSFEMTDRLQRFGYVETEIAAGTVLTAGIAQRMRGHEFHYTKRTDDQNYPTQYVVTKHRRTKDVVWNEGFQKYSALGGYPHFHFYANAQCAKCFLEAAAAYRKEAGRG